jgi:hypothetical protein
VDRLSLVVPTEVADDDVDAHIAELARALVTARAKAMHPAGSARRCESTPEVIDLR